MKKDILTPSEVAQYYRVSHRTVLTWIEDGKLESYQTPGGHHRIQLKQLTEFSKKYDMPMPDIEQKSPQKKVLIVDDDEKLVTALCRFIEEDRDDYIVDVAYDGFSAGKKLATFMPDVVVLDIRMPGIDGFDIARQIKSVEGCAIRVIAMSGYMGDGMRAELRRIGVDAFFDKPMSMADLMEAIEGEECA